MSDPQCNPLTTACTGVAYDPIGIAERSETGSSNRTIESDYLVGGKLVV
jgi:hypothetical protein